MRLIIRSGKGIVTLTWMVLVAMLLMMVIGVAYIGLRDPAMIWIIVVLIPFLACMTLQTVSVSRTIILNKEGCEIRWWRWCSFYSWEQMWYRKWITYSERVSSRNGFDGTIWFSTAPVNIPRFMSAFEVDMFDPFARVGIHLTAAEHRKSLCEMAVDKEEFLAYVTAIGLRIEDLDQLKNEA